MPALATEPFGRNSTPFERIERQRVHSTSRLATSTEGLVLPLAQAIEQRLRQDTARRVARAEKQDVEYRHIGFDMQTADAGQSERNSALCLTASGTALRSITR